MKKPRFWSGNQNHAVASAYAIAIPQQGALSILEVFEHLIGDARHSRFRRELLREQRRYCGLGSESAHLHIRRRSRVPA